LHRVPSLFSAPATARAFFLLPPPPWAAGRRRDARPPFFVFIRAPHVRAQRNGLKVYYNDWHHANNQPQMMQKRRRRQKTPGEWEKGGSKGAKGRLIL
jgi:hypothetical protein